MRRLYMLNSDDLTAIVDAAGQAGVMRFFHFLALRAYREIRGFEMLVGAPLVPAGFRCFVFWIRHGLVLLLIVFLINPSMLRTLRTPPGRPSGNRSPLHSGPFHRSGRGLCSRDGEAGP